MNATSFQTFAISAQLLPASLMVFNLCSSAGVQGVLVLLFLAGGGPIGESVILGSSFGLAAGATAELDAADMAADADADVEAVPVPEARLFRVGEVSDFDVASAAVGRDCEGDDPVAASISVRSARFDIGDRGGNVPQWSATEVVEINVGGRKVQMLWASSSRPDRVWLKSPC